MSHEAKRANRKRRTFLQQQARFFKKGKFGNLSEDTYQYFLRILEVMKRDGKDFELNDWKVMATNVFEEIKGNEVEYSCNQLASRVIEDLLGYSELVTIKDYINNFMKNPRPILTDPFGSHVFEKLILICHEKIKCGFLESEENSEQFLAVCKAFLLNVAKFLFNNLNEFIWDSYANHVTQTCITCFNFKLEYSDQNIDNKIECVEDVQDDFSQMLENFSLRIIEWPMFGELLQKDLTSSLLQSLLLANKGNKRMLKRFIKKVIDEYCTYFERNKQHEVNPIAVRVLETCIMVASKKMYKLIYEKCFKSNLKHLSISRTTNFAVQKLLKYVKNKEDFEDMFVEISQHFGVILSTGHSGIILAAAEECRRLQTKQGEFIKMMSKALNCLEPQERNVEIVPLTCKLTVYGEEMKENKISLHGSLIVQEMLNFNKPIKIVDSLLNMEVENLKNLFCDPCGSHIADSFMTSVFIGEKSREKLSKKFQGHYVSLTMSKHGSRSFDAIWKGISLKQKLSIMEELKVGQSEMVSNQYGKGISVSIKLDYFRRDREFWIKSQNLSSTKEKLFSDIIKKR